MSSAPTYLMSRNGIWYFNYRIPSSIRRRYNIQKLFFRKSLKTKDVRQAVKLSHKYTWMILDKSMSLNKKIDQGPPDELEREIQKHTDSLVIGRKILKNYNHTMENGTYIEQTDFWMGYSQYEYECWRMAVDEANEKQRREEQEKIEKTKKFATIFAKEISETLSINSNKSEYQKEQRSDQGEAEATAEGKDNIVKEETPETSILLSELINAFLKHKKGTWNARTLKLQEGRLRVIREFLEYAIGVDNPMIHQFEYEHSIQFEEEFCKYPKNCLKKFPDLSMKEVMDSVDSVKFADVERISTNNYNEYAQLLMAVFAWAKEDKKRKFLTGDNVFVKLKKTREPYKSYSPFTTDEIRMFFGSPMFKGKKFEERFAWRYWIPIIMMYHGMRLEEVAQLQVKNIVHQNNI